MSDEEALLELAGEVRKLSINIAILAELPKKVENLTKSNDDLRRRGFWNRVLVIATIVGLCIDIAGSIVLWRLNAQQTCLSDLRAKGSVIADSDRRNVDDFFKAVVIVKSPTDFQDAYQSYLAVRDANDVQRDKLGQANSSTCPLF